MAPVYKWAKRSTLRASSLSNSLKAWHDSSVVEDYTFKVKGHQFESCSSHSFARIFISQLKILLWELRSKYRYLFAYADIFFSVRSRKDVYSWFLHSLEKGDIPYNAFNVLLETTDFHWTVSALSADTEAYQKLF